MEFKRFKTEGIAHNAYILGTEGIGIIIDPRRDVDEYLEWALSKKINIKYVLQTHRQEDFVLGSKILKEKLGVIVVASNHPISRVADKRMADDEVFDIGGLSIKTLHTPGHTPESVSYAISLKEHPEKVWAVFTGDALFIGETGRTDLPDRNKTAENAGILFDSIHKKILPLGDNVLIYPAHGAGSVCGGNIAKYDESTLGFERTYNPVFTLSREEFISKKLEERIPRPPYFALIEKLNTKGGLPLEKNWNSIVSYSSKDFEKQIKKGIVIDTRLPEAYAGGHIPESYSIWLDGLPVFGGWIAFENKPVFLVLERSEDLKKAFMHLARIGIDSIKGVLSGGFESWRNEGLPVDQSGIVTPMDLSKSKISLIDVRDITEYSTKGHAPLASHNYVGYLERNSNPVKKHFPKDKPIAVTCTVGHRASLAVSILKRNGYKKVYNLIGGMGAWMKLKLPLKKDIDPKRILDKKEITEDFPYEKIK